MNQNSLSIHQLTKSFDGKEPLFEKASAFIPAGSFAFITGKSGSGKSTLLKMIHRIEKIDSGEIILGNYKEKKSLASFRKNIGFVFQDYRLLENQTVKENIQLPLYIRGLKRNTIHQKTEVIVKSCGIEYLLQEKVKNLSGGEKQLVALARAAIVGPTLILADEPTANLDNEASSKVLNLLSIFHTQGTTILVATHDISLIQAKKSLVFLIQDQQIKKVQSI